MHVACAHNSITQNYCRWVQFNYQLLDQLSSRMEQMGLLIHRLYSSYSSQETVMARKQDEKRYAILPHVLSFHNEWMNYISKTSLMTQFIPELSSQLSGPLKLDLQHSGMGFSFTFSSCVLQAIRQSSLYATTASFAGLVEDSRRKQELLSVWLPKDKHAS